MTTKPPSSSRAAVGVLLLVVVVVAMTMTTTTTTTEAATSPCNPALLTPCAGPAMFGGAVRPECCVQLRAQQGCLCGYARSPNYGSYIRSPNAAKLFAACNMPMPRCG